MRASQYTHTADQNEVRDEVSQLVRAIRTEHGGRRPKYVTYAQYPLADDVLEAGLVGRRECMLMAGYNPDIPGDGPRWFQQCIANGRFPKADGQMIDGKPTWRRATMLVHLYRVYRSANRRYLIPELWPEAEALIGAQRAGDMLDDIAADPQGGFRA